MDPQLIVLRTSLRSQWLGIFGFIVFTIIGLNLKDISYLSLPIYNTDGEMLIKLPLLLLLSLFCLSRPIINIISSRYEISTHHIRSITGLYTNKKIFSEHPFEDILGVETQQNIIDRILNTGNIVIPTKAGPRSIVIKGIVDPIGISKKITSYIDNNRIKQKNEGKANS